MNDRDDFDDAQAAMIDRRIERAFALARVAVDDPDIMDVFADGSELGIEDIVSNPHVPENAFIVDGTTMTGESTSIAVGGCECNTIHDPVRGRFWLRAGEQWVCAKCRRVYAFDGERITVTADADAMIG